MTTVRTVDDLIQEFLAAGTMLDYKSAKGRSKELLKLILESIVPEERALHISANKLGDTFHYAHTWDDCREEVLSNIKKLLDE